jgi:7,8-dihydropterin-6-yl-methyl-4-(beta-D-ribofuranosyl)aminobenzene 5'-phosphate synthase
MKIKVLAEDTSSSPLFRNEHGLSIYIETRDNKILFDTGASDLFLENAKKLNVNIKDVDFAVISHGHYDHGGGLKAFLNENEKSKIYISRKAFERHFSKRSDKITEIGLDGSLISDDRIILTDDIYPVNENALLFSRVAGSEFCSSCNRSLCADKGGILTQDDFEHEQNLVIAEDGKTILIAGCAHKGIVNILKSLAVLRCGNPDYVIGGFHLYDYGGRTSEDPSVVAQIGELLKRTGSMFYTGHCTGPEAYRHLKRIMGDQIQYLAAGTVVEI